MPSSVAVGEKDCFGMGRQERVNFKTMDLLLNNGEVKNQDCFLKFGFHFFVEK